MVQRWRFHLENLRKVDAPGMIRYSADRAKILLARIRNRRERLALLAPPENPDPKGIDLGLQDVDKIVFQMAEEYTPPPYFGNVAIVQGTDTPGGKHWQMSVQWREPLQGHWSVQRVQGGHITMFQAPHVETLAAILRARLQPSSGALRNKSKGLVSDQQIKQLCP